jgi:uncharacterized protein
MPKLAKKRVLILVLSIELLLVQVLFGQKTLRQGAYFTEEAGKAELQNLASHYSTKEAWDTRAALIRQGILAGAELQNYQHGGKVSYHSHSKRKLPGYTVENLYFESSPGIFVTGNLYKPSRIKGKIPAILAPHGHGQQPRFAEATQQRCATLARMGAVVFSYDMPGYTDSQQCNHKFEKAIKLQLINSIRVVDMLCQLPFVDNRRIAVSGESGGATQAILLAAVDSRIAVQVPVVMVSAHFFGGCTCESGMPIHVGASHQTNNAEIAATFAPKPMLLISDGADWTKNTPTVEYPHIRRIYDFYNAAAHVQNHHLPTEKHDYGPSKRQAAYSFLAKYLGLDISKANEQQTLLLQPSQLAVFDLSHPMPSHAIKGDEAVIKALDAL